MKQDSVDMNVKELWMHPQRSEIIRETELGYIRTAYSELKT